MEARGQEEGVIAWRGEIWREGWEEGFVRSLVWLIYDVSEVLRSVSLGQFQL